MSKTSFIAGAFLAATMVVSGCSPSMQRSLEGSIGAGTGALLGGYLTKSPLGAAGGAVAGNVIQDQMRQRDNRGDRGDRYDDRRYDDRDGRRDRDRYDDDRSYRNDPRP